MASTTLASLAEDYPKHIAVIAGAGVTLASLRSTGDVASWAGLLDNGIELCQEVTGLQESAARLLRALVKDGDIHNLLSVGAQIKSRLQTEKSPGVYVDWLTAAFKEMPNQILDDSLLNAIAKLNLPILTTNYDELLEHVTGRQPLTWADENGLVAAQRNPEQFVVHIHGTWNKADTVVLGYDTYDRVGRNQPLKDLLTAWGNRYSYLFIGMGGGLTDPTFRAVRARLPRTEFRHYRLVRGQELQAAWEEHRGEQIYPVAFGARHGRLPDFLDSLRSQADLNEFSQEPGDYAPYSGIRVLDHAARIEPGLADAAELAARAQRLVGQLNHRCEQPSESGEWPAQDQTFLAEQIALSVQAPAERLRETGHALHVGVDTISQSVSRLLSTVELAKRNGDDVTVHVRGALDATLALRALTIAAETTRLELLTDLTTRSGVSDAWKPAVDAVRRSGEGLAIAREIVSQWQVPSSDPAWH